MTPSPSQVKEGLLHPERIVRDFCLRYFADSLSRDTDVMPLAVRAIDTFGWRGAFTFPYRVAWLAQTDETLLWALEQLAGLGWDPWEDKQIRGWLGTLVARAEASLLARHAERINTPGLLEEDCAHAAVERVRLLSADPLRCWGELVEFCGASKDTYDIDEVDMPHAERLAEAAARGGPSVAGPVLEVLSRRHESYEGNPAVWLEPLAARVAGFMRLEAAVRPLIAKLEEDIDGLINEECQSALVGIGTEGVVEELLRDFPQRGESYRLYGAAVLEHIRSNSIASKVPEILRTERDEMVQSALVCAMLCASAPEGIREARRLPPVSVREVRGDAVGVAMLLGLELPELADWKQQEERSLDLAWRFAADLCGDPAPADAGQYRPEDNAEAKPAPAAMPPAEPIRRGIKVGRNDPCPCGSGRKYKKCCLPEEEKSRF